MDLSIYLAFTGAEAGLMEGYCGKTAWLGCRFSPYGSGISSISPTLAHCDMLVLTDETPADSHDPHRVAKELAQTAKQLGCERILLDFQRPPDTLSAQVVKAVLQSSPCPVGVSESHAGMLDCPVLVSPPPLWTALEAHLLPWKGREIWLETATEDACITVTAEGSTYTTCSQTGPFPFFDEALSLSYRIEALGSTARFCLHRGIDRLPAFLAHARDLGVHTAVGLYQQLAAMELS